MQCILWCTPMWPDLPRLTCGFGTLLGLCSLKFWRPLLALKQELANRFWALYFLMSIFRNGKFVTCKGHNNVVIERANFSDGARFLKFSDRLSLNSKDHNIFTTNSNLQNEIPPIIIHWHQYAFCHYKTGSEAKRNQKPKILRTAVEPFFTASCAYSTWKRCPSGENIVIALS